jgi:spoIIIJ-associated protein
MTEFDGKDLEEALGAAASAVGRPAGEIDYELVEGGRKGVFGLGSRRVRIRVTAPGAPADSAPRRMLAEIVRLMGFSLEISEARREGVLELTLDGADRSRLLERDGELITALETVLGRMGRRAWPDEPAIRLTCPGFANAEDADLVRRVREIAADVLRSGSRRSLPEMNPYERRIVHMTIRELPGLRSSSEGEGFLKRVHVEKIGS